MDIMQCEAMAVLLETNAMTTSPLNTPTYLLIQLLEDLSGVFRAATPMLATALNITPEHVRALVDAFTIECRTVDSFFYTTQLYARKKVEPTYSITFEG
jgi:hypothetical protein